MFTTTHWSNALGRDDVLRSIVDTMIVGVTAATLGVIISIFISYVVTRTAWARTHRSRHNGVGSMGGSWSGHEPRLSVGLCLVADLRHEWVVILALVARGLPVASRFFTTTMVQLSAELEESARVHGASWSTDVR